MPVPDDLYLGVGICDFIQIDRQWSDLVPSLMVTILVLVCIDDSIDLGE